MEFIISNTMVNKINLLIMCCLVVGCGSLNTKTRGVIINESTEWSNTWVVNTNDTILPKVLLIGDSHVERYYNVVAENLGTKANCSKFTTSKSLGDPVFIKQLESVLMVCDYDIISFNNGLHGVGYPIDEYAEFVSIAYELLKKNAKKAVIWVNSTAIREPNNITQFASRNQQIIERNDHISEFTHDKNITLIDFYSKTADNVAYYSSDGIHFTNEGVNVEAELVTQEILDILGL